MALVAMRERQVSTPDDVGQEDGTRDKSRGVVHLKLMTHCMSTILQFQKL